MDRIFAMETRVTSYDVGPTRAVRPSAILKIMQEAGGRHLEQDGLTYELMRSRGIVFLLVRLAVAVKRLPRSEDTVTVQTWFDRNEGVRFIRDMRFCGGEGEILIEATTQWIIADPQTHRILRPGAFPFDMPAFGGERVEAAVSKIILPETARTAGSRAVRWSDIDSNGHMNNAVYADILCDYFPGGLGMREVRFFQIDFDGEAALGDEIAIKTAMETRSRAIISGRINGRKCFTAACEAYAATAD
jgi:Acyl-ACP thioesterase